MIELPAGFSVHHELLYWRQGLLDAIDNAIVITLFVLICVSVFTVLLTGRYR